MGLDRQTLAEKYGIKMEGDNKWITLIQNASKINMKLFRTLTKELTARVVIITSIYSIISFIIIERHHPAPNQLEVSIPLLFVTFGVVILINVLFCLRKYKLWNTEK